MPKRSSDVAEGPPVAAVAALSETLDLVLIESAKRPASAGGTVQQPSIGRVVHFVLPSGAHRPADILDVHDDGTIDLLVKTLFGDQVGQLLEWSNAIGDPGGSIPYTWHWPEYVPAKPAEPAAPTGESSDATGA